VDRRDVGICDLEFAAGHLPEVDILGLKVHCIDMPQALDAVRGFIASGTPHMIVTADSSMVVLARRDEDFRALVNSADLVTPDSSGIVLAAKLLGTPVKERVSGCDLSREICRMAAREGFSIYLLGAAPGVAAEAARRLGEEFAGLRIAGTHHGYFDPSQDRRIAAEVKASGAEVLLVGMGIPRQERFIRDNLQDLGVCVAMGVGGTLDVLSGRVKRAPVWMQRHGLEWLHRLIVNPRKFPKVAALPRFLAMVLWARAAGAGSKVHNRE